MLVGFRRFVVSTAICGGVASIVGGSALAQGEETARAAIEDWVAGIDALPEIAATFESLTGVGPNAVLTGLTINGQELVMVFEPITVSGYRAIESSGFAFESFEVSRVQARTPTTEINVIDFVVENIVVPETGFVFEPKQPITSILDIWGDASAFSIDQLSIGRIDIGQFEGGLNAIVSYHNYVIQGWADGRIESTSAGPLIMESPSPDALFVLTVDDMRSDDFDFNAIAWVLDPTAYANGDREWRTVLGHAEYNNIIVQAPDLQLRIRGIEIDDFRMRQAAEPFTPLLERMMSNPNLSDRDADEMMQDIIVDLISPWGLGAFTIHGVDLYADDIDRFHIGDFHIETLSLDGLGEIGLSDIDIVISDEGYLKANTIAIGGIVMPPEETIEAFFAAIATGDEPGAAINLVPDLGYIEVAGFEFGTSGALPITLDRLLIGSGGNIGALPTRAEFEVRGFTVPLTFIEGETRQLLNRLGFTEFTIDLGIYIKWNEADETLLFEGLHIAIEGAGSIEASLALGGITRSMIENPDALDESSLLGISFLWAEISVRDESVADRLFQWTAEGTNTPADQYRREFIAGLPVILGLTIDRTIALAVSPPIQAFLREPSELIISARPEDPVSLVSLTLALDSSPFGLLELLGVELTTEPLD